MTRGELAIRTFVAWAKANAPEYYAQLLPQLRAAFPNGTLAGLDGWEAIATTVANVASSVAGAYASISNAEGQRKAIQAQIDILKQQQAVANQPAPITAGSSAAPRSQIVGVNWSLVLPLAGLGLLLWFFKRSK